MKLGKALGLAPLQVAQALLGFGTLAAFTRLMSPEEFGRYALALSSFMFAHTLVFTWAEAAAFRFYAAARAQGRLQDHFATLTTMALALGAGALLLTGGVLILFGATRDLAVVCAFAAGSAVFRFLTKISRETDRADMALGRYAVSETFYLTFGFAVGLALLTRFDLGPAAPFAGMMLAGIVTFAIDAPRLRKRARGGVASPERARLYAAYGTPLALAIAIDLGVQALARFILAHQAGEAALGAYAAAFGLTRPLDLVFMGLGTAMTPLLLAAYEDRGPEAARRAAAQMFTTIAAIALPAATGLALIAQPLSGLLVGSALSANAAQALPWLALAGVLTGFNTYYWSEAFQLSRRTGLRALVMLTPGLLQVALTLQLAPTHGAAGAAMAAAAAASAGALMLFVAGRHLLALPLPTKTLLKTALACAIMALEITALPAPSGFLGIAAIAGIGAITYGVAALALDLFDLRARASAVFQRLARMMEGSVEASFTDQADAAPR